MACFAFVFELRLLLPDAGVECAVPRLDLVRGRGCEVGQGCETHRQDSFVAPGRAAAITRWRRAKISATGSGSGPCGIVSGVGVVEVGIVIVSDGGLTMWSPGRRARKRDGAAAGRARSVTAVSAWAPRAPPLPGCRRPRGSKTRG